AGSPPIARRAKLSLCCPVRASRRWTAAASTVPWASKLKPATLPRPPVTRSTDVPATATSTSRAGSSLPDSRSVPTWALMAKAAVTPSTATTACERGRPVMMPASRSSACARAAVPGEQPACWASCRTGGTISPAASRPAMTSVATPAATACAFCVMQTGYRELLVEARTPSERQYSPHWNCCDSQRSRSPDPATGLRRVVPPEIRHRGVEIRRLEQLPQRRDQRVLKALGLDHEVVRFLRDRHKVEPERASGGHDAEATVGTVGGDGCRDREMGRFLARVAVEACRVDPEPVQLLVEQHPGARTALSVDVAQAAGRQVSEPGDTTWVAGRHQQHLVAVHEAHDGQLSVGHHLVEVRQRVFPGGRVKQVRTGNMTQPVAQRDQSTERADVGRHQRQRWVCGAQRRGCQVDDQVMRTDGDDRALDL